MGLVNYFLAGLLGSMVAMALYAAQWDMSRSSTLEAPQATTSV